MNVYLIRTPEYDSDNFWEVVELLQSTSGAINFKGDDVQFSSIEFPFLGKFWESFKFSAVENPRTLVGYEDDKGYPLSWRELFSICSYYRNKNDVQKSDFVVLLTKRKNALNFFSIFNDDQNVFVQTSEWDLFTEVSHKFPVAYEVVMNILQSLMKLSLILPNPYIHEEPLGCMNDLCQNKRDVLLKLRTGDICPTCMNKIQQEGVSGYIIDHVLTIFESIRSQLLFKQGFRRNLSPNPINVSDTGQIKIGGRELENLTPIYKTLFLFFLKHSESGGVRRAELSNFKTELTTIYKILRRSGNTDVIDKLISLRDNYFSENKAKLNKLLREQIGEPLANYYTIEGKPGEAFKINIDNSLVNWDIRV